MEGAIQVGVLMAGYWGLEMAGKEEVCTAYPDVTSGSRGLNHMVVIQMLSRALGLVPWAADLETGVAHDKVSSRTTAYQPVTCNADVAQLVAHHLAKVRVASSSLVIRSKAFLMLEGSSSKKP